MKVINKISDVVYFIEKVLAFTLAMTLLISMVGGFFFRYVLKSPLLWSDELAIFCLIWITFIGGSMVLKEKAHLPSRYSLMRFRKRIKNI